MHLITDIKSINKYIDNIQGKRMKNCQVKSYQSVPSSKKTSILNLSRGDLVEIKLTFNKKHKKEGIKQEPIKSENDDRIFRNCKDHTKIKSYSKKFYTEKHSEQQSRISKTKSKRNSMTGNKKLSTLSKSVNYCLKKEHKIRSNSMKFKLRSNEVDNKNL